MSSRFGSFARQAAAPLAGFVAGWGIWQVLEAQDLVTLAQRQQIVAARARVELTLHRVLPEGTAASLLAPAEELEALVAALGSAPDGSEDDRLRFIEILRQCRVEEQIDWLEDHCLEAIPYFFISDLFHAFAQLHEAGFSLPISSDSDGGTAAAGGSRSLDVIIRDDARFHSEVLCRRVAEMLESGVLPFDVSVPVLAVLAIGNKKNAAHLAAARSSDGSATLLEVVGSKFAAYQADLEEKGTPEGDDNVTAEIVEIATLQLVRALNASLVAGRPWYAPWRPPTGPLPLLRGLEAPVVASTCNVLVAASKRPICDLTAAFDDDARAYLKCGAR